MNSDNPATLFKKILSMRKQLKSGVARVIAHWSIYHKLFRVGKNITVFFSTPIRIVGPKATPEQRLFHIDDNQSYSQDGIHLQGPNPFLAFNALAPRLFVNL